MNKDIGRKYFALKVKKSSLEIMTLGEFVLERNLSGFVTQTEQYELFKYGIHALIQMDVNTQSQVCKLYTMYIDMMNFSPSTKNKK